MDTTNKPNPGSDEAVELGCKCPVMDNRRGKGAYFDAFGMPVFWYSDDCAVHSNYNKGSQNASATQEQTYK